MDAKKVDSKPRLPPLVLILLEGNDRRLEEGDINVWHDLFGDLAEVKDYRLACRVIAQYRSGRDRLTLFILLCQLAHQHKGLKELVTASKHFSSKLQLRLAMGLVQHLKQEDAIIATWQRSVITAYAHEILHETFETFLTDPQGIDLKRLGLAQRTMEKLTHLSAEPLVQRAEAQRMQDIIDEKETVNKPREPLRPSYFPPGKARTASSHTLH